MISTGKTKRAHGGNQGFSIIELLISLALIVVLLTVAVPNINTFIKNNRRSAQINDFIASLQNARSEAVTRGVKASICPSSNGTDCDGSNWEEGWLVFMDDDGDGVSDSTDGDGNRDSDETLLRIVGPLSSGNTLRSSLSSLTYNSNGALTAGVVEFQLCDSRGDSEARLIRVAMSGRPRAETGDTICP